MSGVEPQTPAGQPITAFDERLVRMTNRNKDGWPIPALLAEIDRLRAIEAAARTMFDGADPICPDCGVVGRHGREDAGCLTLPLRAALGIPS